MYKNRKNNIVEELTEYCRGLKSNLDGKKLYDKYEEYIKNIRPQQIFEIFYKLIEEGSRPDELLVFLDRVINAIYDTLLNYRWQKPQHDDFLMDLVAENEALLARTDEIKELLKETDLQIKKENLLAKIRELQQFEHHYLKKENILFPYMENAMDKFHGLSIMWELHDVVRNRIKQAISIMDNSDSTEKDVNKAIADILFGMLGLKKKEELILFPAASEVLDDYTWYQMYRQSLEYDFSFIEKPEIKLEDLEQIEILEEGSFKTETGELSLNQILMIFNNLPVDFTFVNEHNKVRYFTKPKDRIFPRSPAVIGRDVSNCHPPASVDIVEEIIEGFRSGKEDFTQFWINIKGRIILIQYFALRDRDGVYKGVLEVSQDITEIKQLEGERRLLKWRED